MHRYKKIGYLFFAALCFYFLTKQIIGIPTFYDLQNNFSNLSDTLKIDEGDEEFFLDWKNPKDIIGFLNESRIPVNQRANILMDSLNNRLFLTDEKNINSDQLISNYYAMIIWTIELRALEKSNQNLSNTFNTVRHYWYNAITNAISDIVQNNTKMKYDFRVYFISGVLNSELYYPAFKNSMVEKIVLNLLQGNFGYILNRFWIGTTWWSKILITTIFLGNIYIYYEFIKRFF
jgi:hypothetical protein